jgi:hypothetical protein
MIKDRHISLGLVMHNHQPVGQSDEVFEEIYERTYELMIGALERHPGVRLGIHYTGSLLDWLRESKPDFMRRIRALVARGQVEVLSGGYYEPILPTIPDDDKRAQIEKLSEAVRNDFGYDPTGMWLAERVWEPTLPTHLANAGIQWTLLDDIHFKMVGLTDDDLAGYYVTEDNGNAVNVFATSKQLRYTIPWRPVEETIRYLYDEALPQPGKILVMGDDGEKFGAWPETYEHSWSDDGKSGWVDHFFSALEENSSWIHTVRLGDYIRHFPAIGRIYLPTASYNEMMEWALPARRAAEFNQLYKKMEEAKHPAVEYMKAGFWRNFMAKYPEVNTQHKKMLRVHNKIHQARQVLAERGGDGNTDVGYEDLLRAQSNDTYWHGLFGGVYMTDIRTRVHAHLIKAQQAAERVIYGDQSWIAPEITDFDRDSMHELLIEGNALNLYIDLADGGSIFEWDLRPHNYNLASTVTRRPESYHEMLREVEEARRRGEVRGARGEGSGDGDKGSVVRGQGSGVGSEAEDGRSKGVELEEGAAQSPHDAVRVKEVGLDRYLNYDSYRRACMIDHFLGPGTTLEGFIKSDYNEEGDFATGAYHAEMHDDSEKILYVVLQRDGHINTGEESKPVRVSKRLCLKPGSSSFRVQFNIQNTGDTELTAVFGTEWNINLLGGGHNPSAYYKVEGYELEDAALDSTGEVRNVSELAVGNSWLGIEMACKTSHPATFWRFPVETVSGSEAGFERTYQGSCILLHWLLKLPPTQSVDIELEWIHRNRE